ncbi:MAG TPA: hypothetical protein PKE55_05825 [Kiritimatiellia bacterium]|nr:hypothetical protein [Kiritimatiellia bacterium]
MKRTLFPLLLICLAFVHASAQPPGVIIERVAKAQPDEWFNGRGQPYLPLGAQPPGSPGFPKVNHDYVWAMASSQGEVWIGDVANLVCRVAAIRYALGLDQTLGTVDIPPVYEVAFRECEFDQSRFPGIPSNLPRTLRALLGDWRPPRMFTYNLQSGLLTDRTPPDPLLENVAGFRAAGANQEIVLLAGPDLFGNGLILAAFDARTRAYLGARRFREYSNIRRFVTLDNILYTTVLDEQSPEGAGAVLRWTGSLATPFRFEVVGRLRNEGANIAAHEGRLFVTTWPDTSAIDEPVTLRDYIQILLGRTRGQRDPSAGLWMSPPIPSGGLRSSHAQGWRKVWDMIQVEPDPVVVQTLAGGALHSYNGFLYWGTLQFPGRGVDAFTKVYGNPANVQEVLDNTQRGAYLLRGRNFSARRPQIEVLYADAEVPVYSPPRFRRPGGWALRPTRQGQGRYGTSGFGNRDNIYIWSMAEYQGHLYVGTFDQSIYRYGRQYMLGQPVPAILGADLYRFTSIHGPATPVSLDGGGNPLNHGFRNMVSTPFGLFLGTANISNLLTDPDDPYDLGGWELLRLRYLPP